MLDVSSLGSAGTQPQAASAVIRPPERVESERVEAKDSEIERGEAERSENALQNKAKQQAFADAHSNRRSDTIEDAGQNVDVLV